VLGALLPVLTVAWRRVLVPYLALLVLTAADSLGVGARISGGHQGILEQLAMILAACLLGVAPWVPTIAARLGLPVWRSDGHPPDGQADGSPGARGAPGTLVTSGGAATIVAAAAVVVAALVVIVNGLASAPATGLALVIAGGAAVLVVGIRIFMLVRENSVAVRMWRESADSLRDLADRTGDMVLDLRPRRDDQPTRARPRAASATRRGALVGKDLVEFVQSGGRRGDPGCGPAGARSRGERGHGGQRGAWRRGRYGVASPAGCAPRTGPGGTSNAPCSCTGGPASPRRCW